MNTVLHCIGDYVFVRYIVDPVVTWAEEHTREARQIGLLWVLYKTRRLGNARYQRRIEVVAMCYALPLLLKAFVEHTERAKAVRLALEKDKVNTGAIVDSSL